MSWSGMGRGGRRVLAEPAYCVCSNCSYGKPHVRGIPCMSMTCPKCGAMMLPAS